MLEPDRDQIELFTDAVFRHAGAAGFVAFYEDDDKPFSPQQRAAVERPTM